mmetsp:Transcript_36925/g.101626  ORF Transcript_36925/g.101626 Transcript_36925/m.101626 type:complete len:303 (+) Transcript_36925:168-1076(+)
MSKLVEPASAKSCSNASGLANGASGCPPATGTSRETGESSSGSAPRFESAGHADVRAPKSEPSKGFPDAAWAFPCTTTGAESRNAMDPTSMAASTFVGTASAVSRSNAAAALGGASAGAAAPMPVSKIAGDESVVCRFNAAATSRGASASTASPASPLKSAASAEAGMTTSRGGVAAPIAASKVVGDASRVCVSTAAAASRGADASTSWLASALKKTTSSDAALVTLRARVAAPMSASKLVGDASAVPTCNAGVALNGASAARPSPASTLKSSASAEAGMATSGAGAAAPIPFKLAGDASVG